MARNGDALGTAIWTAIKATQTFSPALSSEDDAKGLAVWQAFGNAFYTYDNANTVVLPNTMNNPSGQAVVVSPSTGDGATSAPQVIAGTGLLS
jgi:hypothetical protein